MSGIYPSRYESFILDAYASGPLRLLGREHQLVVGGQASRSTGKEYEDFYTGEILYPAVGRWAVEQPAELTRFAFEPGCMLRMKIQQKKERPERPSKGRQR